MLASGRLAAENSYRFSTKYLDQESELYYYGYRFYHSEFGRWTQRDPIGEEMGGNNLLAFVANNAMTGADGYGLRRIKFTADAFIPWEEVRTGMLVPLHPAIFAASASVWLMVHGDGRLPGTHPGESARLTSWAEIDTDREEVLIDLEAANQPSSARWVSRLNNLQFGETVTGRGPFLPKEQAIKLEKRNGKGCKITVTVMGSGSVPVQVAGPQPAIDFQYTFAVTPTATGTVISMLASHDGFPGHEVFIEADGQVVFNRHYTPDWFANEVGGPGTVAKPSWFNQLRVAGALGGSNDHQFWISSVKF